MLGLLCATRYVNLLIDVDSKISSIKEKIFTGKLPFHGARDGIVLRKILKGDRPEFPTRFDSQSTALGLTEDFNALIRNCWDQDPAIRPHSANVLSRLEQVMPEDRRPPGEGLAAPAMRSEWFSDPDIPLTMEDLTEIFSRDPPPRGPRRMYDSHLRDLDLIE